MKTFRTFFFYVFVFTFVLRFRLSFVLRFRLSFFSRFRFCHKVNIQNVFFTFSESLGVFALSGWTVNMIRSPEVSTGKSSRKEYSGLNRPARIKRQELSFF